MRRAESGDDLGICATVVLAEDGNFLYREKMTREPTSKAPARSSRGSMNPVEIAGDVEFNTDGRGPALAGSPTEPKVRPEIEFVDKNVDHDGPISLPGKQRALHTIIPSSKRSPRNRLINTRSNHVAFNSSGHSLPLLPRWARQLFIQQRPRGCLAMGLADIAPMAILLMLIAAL